MTQAIGKPTGRLLTLSSLAGAAIGFLVLSFTLLITSESHGKEALEISGFVDRSTIREGDQIHLVVNIVNAGPETVKLESVKTLFSPDRPCNLGNPLLASNQMVTATCQQTLEKEGQYNGGVQVSWLPLEKGATQQSISKNLGIVAVLPRHWPTRSEGSLLGAAALVLLLALLTWIKNPKGLSAFRTGCKFFLLFSFVMTSWGLVVRNGVIATVGLLAAFVAWTLLRKGEDFFDTLLDRLQEIGPVKLSPRTSVPEAEILNRRRMEFLNPETKLEEILKLEKEKRLDLYVEFLRLKSYSFEAMLVIYFPEIPPPNTAGRISWLNKLQTRTDLKPGQELFNDLGQVYKDLQNHENFKKLLVDELIESLKEAQKSTQNEKELISKVITKLEGAKQGILTPLYFTTLGRLFVILEKYDLGLAALYEGRGHFPDSSACNAFLGWYVAELHNDFMSARRYESEAVRIVTESEKQVAELYKQIYDRILRNEKSEFALHLKRLTDEHQDLWKAKLSNWFKTLRLQMMNNVAWNIACGRISEFQLQATEYAEGTVKDEPEYPPYIDTLGFVKFAFADTLPTRDEIKEELKEALKLFDRAIYLAREKNDIRTLRDAELHREEVNEALRRR